MSGLHCSNLRCSPWNPLVREKIISGLFPRPRYVVWGFNITKLGSGNRGVYRGEDWHSGWKSNITLLNTVRNPSSTRVGGGMYGTSDILAALNGDDVADTAVLAKHVIRQCSCSDIISQRSVGVITENWLLKLTLICWFQNRTHKNFK
jgi:hypothetical protein